jgi:hypothetical protein
LNTSTRLTVLLGCPDSYLPFDDMMEGERSEFPMRAKEGVRQTRINSSF